MYKNYIFDLYGTLIDIRTDENTSRFWNQVSDILAQNGAKYIPGDLRKTYVRYCRAEMAKVILTHPTVRHIDIDILNVFKRLYAKKGVKADEKMLFDTAKKFRRASTKHIRLYDGVEDLLSSLKARGGKIFLLSNAQRSFTFPEIEQLGLDEFFDGILISSDVKMCKPEKRFFNTLVKRYGLEKSECIMIGNDKNSDIGGAVGVGIDSLYIHQDISPAVEDGEEVPAKWTVMDGDVRKIREILLKDGENRCE